MDNIAKLLRVNNQVQSNPKQSIGNSSIIGQGFFLINELNGRLEQQRKKLLLKYAFPANFQKANIHKTANKFGYAQQHIHSQDQQKCQCCGLLINNQKINICCETTDISKPDFEHTKHQFQLSSSVSLFFSFIKIVIGYLIVRFLISDLYNMYSSLTLGKYCATTHCHGIYIVTSGHNRLGQNDLLLIQDILNIFTVIFSIIFLTFCRKWQFKIHDTIDAKLQTEDDYTIFVQNIPILHFSQQFYQGQTDFEFRQREQLIQFFTDLIDKWINDWHNFGSYAKGQIEREYFNEKIKPESQKYEQIITAVTMCYDLGQTQTINTFKQDLMDNVSNLAFEGSSMTQSARRRHSSYIYSQKQVKQMSEQMSFLINAELAIGKKYIVDDSIAFSITHFVGKAFISFQYQHFRDYILREAALDPNFLTFHGKVLQISKASKPEDIFWENLRLTKTQRRFRVGISFVIMGMTLFFAFIGCLGLQTLKTKVSQQDTSTKNPNQKILQIYLKLMYLALYQFTKFQKQATRTDFFLSFIIKLVIFQCLNTAFVYFIISRIQTIHFLNIAGLVNQIGSVLITFGFIQIIVNAVSPMNVWRKVRLWWKYRKVNKQNDTVNKFQCRLNQQYQLPQFNLAERYSYYLVQILTLSFYQYLIPIGSIALVIIFSIQYWIEKYNLFYRSSLTYDLDLLLSRAVIKILDFSLVLFTVGNLLFEYYTSSSNRQLRHIHIISLFPFLLSIINILIVYSRNQQEARKMLRTDKIVEPFSYTDSFEKDKFEFTYWRTNPATRLLDQRFISKQVPTNNLVKKVVFGIGKKLSLEGFKKGEIGHKH